MKEIPLTQGKIALVDDDDYLLLSKFKWYACKGRHTYYASRKENRERREMHRVILGLSDGNLHTDHINGNGLDNRKCNLRIVTIRQNQQNQHIIKTSKYCGVTKKGNGWQSQMNYRGRRRYLGFFKTEEDASTAYLVATRVLEAGAP